MPSWHGPFIAELQALQVLSTATSHILTAMKSFTFFFANAFAILVFFLLSTSNAVSVERELFTGLQFGLDTAVSKQKVKVSHCILMLSPPSLQNLLSPGRNYLETIGQEPRNSKIAKVHKILETLTSLLQYQHSLTDDSQQVIAIKTIVQAITEETCIWVRIC